MELLPHDIISKDFESEPWKYSSHMDFTTDNGIMDNGLRCKLCVYAFFPHVLCFYLKCIALICMKGAAIFNIEGALVFSPTSFLPRSAMANLTAYILGRSFNILEVFFYMYIIFCIIVMMNSIVKLIHAYVMVRFLLG